MYKHAMCLYEHYRINSIHAYTRERNCIHMYMYIGIGRVYFQHSFTFPIVVCNLHMVRVSQERCLYILFALLSCAF